MDFPKFFRELFGLFLFFWALFLLLSLISFDANDPSINVVKTGVIEIKNSAGLFGAYSAGFLNDIFGIGSLFWPFVFAFLGAAYVSAKVYLRWWRWVGIFLLSLCVLTLASAFNFSIGDLSGGGVIGNAFYFESQHWLSPAGSWLLWLFITLIGAQLTFNFSWFQFLRRVKEFWFAKFMQHQNGKLSLPGFSEAKTAFSSLHAKGKKRLSSFFRAKIDNAISLLKNLPAEITQSGAPASPVTQNSDPASNLPALDNPGSSETVSNSDSSPRKIAESLQDPAPLSLRPEIVTGAENTAESENPPAMDPIPSPMLQGESEQDAEWEIESSDSDFSEAEEESELEDDLPEWGDKELDKPREPLTLPSPDLLQPAPVKESIREDLQAKGQALIKCFADFDIQGQLVGIAPGPVVTMFQFKPNPGIRISKIANLSDEVSLALKAVAVRIQAPIPGSDTVGIEIPNEIREIVNFRELVESDEFQHASGPLTMILGKDISGKAYLADLAEMPHLLVAGATGAGKSVCLNSILVSLLYKCQPEDLRLLLVDPKRIEMAVYADLPHLVHPVVTDMNDAKNALDWATHEMDRRFNAMQLLGARNLAAYNKKLASLGPNRLEEFENLEHLPYIVIVIDELADLMMTAAREVQSSIVRLAQLSRAAGIHMILATQRPSVDVVTGLIKANFINRISFQVTSKHDSRTILDQQGAEYLLGRGDMLFKPKGGKLLRLHGPFLSDEEVQLVANHWKNQSPPEYEIDFSRWNPEAKNTSTTDGETGTDPIYEEARDFVMEQGRASISQLQRRFNIGFARAGRLVDQLERGGVIGPANGSKPRQILQN